MNSEEITALLKPHFLGAQLEVESDGRHAQVVIVSDVFEGLGPVKRQQLVYAVLNEHIASGALHAVQMQLFTVKQWQDAQA